MVLDTLQGPIEIGLGLQIVNPEKRWKPHECFRTPSGKLVKFGARWDPGTWMRCPIMGKTLAMK